MTEAVQDDISFDECDCDDPVPDPLTYDLPEDTTVSLTACADCGDLIEWELEGRRTEEELREVLRAKQAEITELKSELEDRDDESVSNLQQIIDEKNRRIDELEAELAGRPSVEDVLEQRDDELVAFAESVTNIKEERDRLREDSLRLENRIDELNEEIESLQEQANRGYKPFPWLRGFLKSHGKQLVSIGIGIGVTGIVGYFVFSGVTEAVAQTSAETFKINLSPAMFLAAFAFVVVVFVVLTIQELRSDSKI